MGKVIDLKEPNNIIVDRNPIFLDLIEYTKLHKDLAIKRCNYAATELAILWHSKKSVIDYYTSTDLYIYDLVRYQMILENAGDMEMMLNQVKKIGYPLKILEWGGGIGQFSLLISKDSVCHYYDLDGPIRDFAMWRFAKSNGNDIIVHDEDPLDESWDIVMIMDVLEHLEDPEKIISKLSDKARYIICNPNKMIHYSIYYPQHISRYQEKLEEFFDYIGENLWKNKN